MFSESLNGIEQNMARWDEREDARKWPPLKAQLIVNTWFHLPLTRSLTPTHACRTVLSSHNVLNIRNRNIASVTLRTKLTIPQNRLNIKFYLSKYQGLTYLPFSHKRLGRLQCTESNRLCSLFNVTLNLQLLNRRCCNQFNSILYLVSRFIRCQALFVWLASVELDGVTTPSPLPRLPSFIIHRNIVARLEHDFYLSVVPISFGSIRRW